MTAGIHFVILHIILNSLLLKSILNLELFSNFQRINLFKEPLQYSDHFQEQIETLLYLFQNFVQKIFLIYFSSCRCRV